MTRREEIEQQAEMFRQPYKGSGNYSTSIDIKNAFQEGAKWADRTMIEKATQWLFENVFYYPDESDNVALFRKTMEE